MQISRTPAVIVALPNRKGGVRQTTPALQLARVCSREGKRDHLIDGPPHVARSMRSALLAAELVSTPAQPSPFGGWVIGEILRLGDACALHPPLVARFVLSRHRHRAIIARGTAQALANPEPPMLAGFISQSVTFADAARSRRLFEVPPAAREIAVFAVAGVLHALLGRELSNRGAAP